MPIHKKSSQRKCGNYRGISLLRILGKVRDLNVWLRLQTDVQLLEEQGGFRSDRGGGGGLIDQIFLIRQLVEKDLENVFAAFIDLVKGI